MTKHRSFLIAAVVAIALTMGVGSNVAAAELATSAPAASVQPSLGWGDTANLTDIEVSTDSHGAAVVHLIGEGLIEYETLLLDNPPRLVVDLSRTVSRLTEHQLDVGVGGVARVRAGQYRAEPQAVARVVLDLTASGAYHVERADNGLKIRFGDQPTGDVEPAAQAEAAPAPVSLPREALEQTLEEVLDEPAPSTASRSVDPETLEQLLGKPELAAPAPSSHDSGFDAKTIVTEEITYSGKRISLNLVDADIKQVFRLFHEISGLNFVLDPTVDGRVTIVLDNVPWDQALDLILKNNGLDKVLENNVIRIAPTRKLADEAAQRKQLKEAKELEVEPVTITRTLSYAKSKDVERVIAESGILTVRGKVIVDERTNTLIISDIPKKVAPIDQLVSALDTETPQVMIEARIVETSREFVQDFGVQWGFDAIADASRGTSLNNEFPHNLTARYGLNLPGPGTASSLGFTFGNVLDSFTLDLALNALETEGRGRVLSSPKIATQNNERAEIEQGIRIPVVNTTATEINVEYVSASLRLGVTPQITAEGTIILDINVENNTPDFVNRVGDVPPINTQRAETKVLIADGGTTVIGGIFTVNEGRSETGVPWFRKVPVFGWLFKSRNITQENRELLIFITPKIMTIG